MKKLLTFVAVIFLILVGLLFAKNIIAKVAIEKGVQAVTGLELKMSKFDFSLLKTHVGINELQLFNPPEYSDRVMLDMPEIFVNYNLSDLFKGKVHVEDFRLHLKEFVIVKNADGELNIDALKPVQEQKKEEKVAEEEEPKEKGKAPEIQIDNLELRIEKVIYKDYSKGGEPRVKEFNINLNESYSDITDLDAIISLIIVKTMMNTTIGSLANFDVGGLQGSISDTLASSQEMAAVAVDKAQQQLLETTDAAQELLKEPTADSLQKASEATQGITDSLKGTTDSLKEKFKFSFGKED